MKYSEQSRHRLTQRQAMIALKKAGIPADPSRWSVKDHERAEAVLHDAVQRKLDRLK